MSRISMDDRLAINALLDMLVEDGETFDARAASELIERLPLSPRSSPFQFRAMSSGDSTSRGYAAGVGDTSIKDTEQKSISVGSDRRWRIGGYKIEHSLGQIEISLLWTDTLEDESGKACRLIYDRITRRPIEMTLAKDLFFSIGPLTVKYAQRFDNWKRPG